MGLDEIRLKEAVDLRDRIADIRGDDGLLADLDEKLAAHADENADDPAESERQLRDLTDRLEGQAKACERVLRGLCPEHSYDPEVHDAHPCPGVDCEAAEGVFVLQELMTAETGLLQDDVSERSVDVDVQRQEATASPKQGYHRIRTLQLAMVDAPAEMDTRQDAKLGREVYQVGDLPDLVSDYLYECAVALNETGELEGVGNLSSYGVETTTASSAN